MTRNDIILSNSDGKETVPMDYRTENQCYWENRAEGYSLVNQTELHTAQHKRWQAHLDAQIRAQHPGKSREEIGIISDRTIR